MAFHCPPHCIYYTLSTCIYLTLLFIPFTAPSINSIYSPFCLLCVIPHFSIWHFTIPPPCLHLTLYCCHVSSCGGRVGVALAGARTELAGTRTELAGARTELAGASTELAAFEGDFLHMVHTSMSPHILLRQAPPSYHLGSGRRPEKLHCTELCTTHLVYYIRKQ